MALDEAALREDVRRRLFAASSIEAERTIGAEVEVIPFSVVGHRPPPLVDLIAAVRCDSGIRDWSEQSTDAGVPWWVSSGGGKISFEPGGQIEVASRPLPNCSAVIRELRDAMHSLAQCAEREAVELLTTGVDPYNDVSAVKLALHSERYERMTSY